MIRSPEGIFHLQLFIYSFMKIQWSTPICSYIHKHFHGMMSPAKVKCIVGYQTVPLTLAASWCRLSIMCGASTFPGNVLGSQPVNQYYFSSGCVLPLVMWPWELASVVLCLRRRMTALSHISSCGSCVFDDVFICIFTHSRFPAEIPMLSVSLC